MQTASMILSAVVQIRAFFGCCAYGCRSLSVDYEVFADQAKAAESKNQFASQRKVKLGLALALTILMVFGGSFVLYSAPTTEGFPT